MTTSIDARPGDRTLWRIVQGRVAAGASMQAIADEAGWDVSELCDWVLAYREQRHEAVANHGALATMKRLIDVDDADLSIAANARRFSVWRRQQVAAKERLAEIAAENAEILEEGYP